MLPYHGVIYVFLCNVFFFSLSSLVIFNWLVPTVVCIYRWNLKWSIPSWKIRFVWRLGQTLARVSAGRFWYIRWQKVLRMCTALRKNCLIVAVEASLWQLWNYSVPGIWKEHEKFIVALSWQSQCNLLSFQDGIFHSCSDYLGKPAKVIQKLWTRTWNFKDSSQEISK